MSRRVLTWAASFAAAASLVMAPGAASADDEAVDPSNPVVVEPTTAPTTTPTTTPTAPPADPGSGGGQGDVIVPDPAAPGPSAPRVLVFGDSISAPGRYRAQATNGLIKAWWAYVADGAQLDPDQVMVSAEAGSGIVTRGGNNRGVVCTGSTFGDRLAKIAETRPDVIMVEVGRNDIWDCAGTRRVPVDPAERRFMASAYFSRLAQEADRNGVARSKVYVMTAWGSHHSGKQVAVTTLYESYARAKGFTWVPLAALPEDQTLDGVHPNARGARTLGTSVLQASDLAVAISSRGQRSGTVASGASVRCQGITACKKLKSPTWAYAKAPKRVWGVTGPSARHLVAHALTTRGATAPILKATTARDGRLDALAFGSAVETAHPKAGDVAWWPTAPAGVRGGSAGHVAVVERVSSDNT
ncbi:MAG: GDSL-type esterase/lipase family protein, partial [Aeromicrobium sp.]